MSLRGKRVAFIALQGLTVFRNPDQRPIGGAEVQLAQMATLLAQTHDCRARVICLGPADALERHGPDDAPVEIAVLARGRHPAAQAWRLYQALVAFDADVVIQRSWGIETWIAARYAHARGKRFVFMIASTVDAGPFAASDWLRWRRLFYRWGLRGADRIVAQKREQVDQLRRNWGRNATIIRSVQPPPEPRRPDKRGLLWVGRAVEVKRPELALDLAERLPERPFTFVLNPSHRDDYSQALARRADALANVERIEFVPYESIMDYFGAARMFINTSEFEGFPNTFLQACRARTPLMSLAVNPEGIIERERLGLCANGDLDALARAIDTRYDDPTWLSETGDRCAEYLKRYHSPARISQQWGDLLESL